MKETLHIKNFGPIKEVKLEFNKVTILIGDHGTGKSTISKLYALIHELLAYNEKLPQTVLAEVLRVTKDKYQLTNFFSLDTQFEFEIPEVIKIDFKSNQCNIDINDSFYLRNNSRIQRFEKPMYVPAERLILSRIDTAVLLKLNEYQTLLAPYISNYASIFHSAKKELNYQAFNVVFKSLFGLEYLHENDLDLIVLPNGMKIKLEESSSAIQTNLNILVCLFYLTSSFTVFGNKYIILEELELSLFPEKIKELTYELIDRINRIPTETISEQGNFHIVFNTHSPYLLSSMNNLMYAYQVGQLNNEETKKVISEGHWVNPGNVSAYMLVYDKNKKGVVEKNIMNLEAGLIDVENIDGVSGIINNEFNKLVDIEIMAENETH